MRKLRATLELRIAEGGTETARHSVSAEFASDDHVRWARLIWAVFGCACLGDDPMPAPVITGLAYLASQYGPTDTMMDIFGRAHGLFWEQGSELTKLQAIRRALEEQTKREAKAKP